MGSESYFCREPTADSESLEQDPPRDDRERCVKFRYLFDGGIVRVCI